MECVEIIRGRAHVELAFVQRSQLSMLSICYEVAERDVTEEEPSLAVNRKGTKYFRIVY